MDVDTELFLPAETMECCQQRLDEIGFTARLDKEDKIERPFIRYHLSLRKIVVQHMEGGQEPILNTLPAPKKDGSWYEDLLQRYFLGDNELSGDPIPAAFRTQIQEAYEEDDTRL